MVLIEAMPSQLVLPRKRRSCFACQAQDSVLVFLLFSWLKLKPVSFYKPLLKASLHPAAVQVVKYTLSEL
jgi:hypothetical protein